MSMSGPTSELPMNKTYKAHVKFYHLLQTVTSSTVDTEKCSLSPVNSQIFPIFKELIDIAQLLTKKVS